MSDHNHFDCREAFSRLDDYLDRELTAEEMSQVKAHLAKCEMCAREFQFEGSVLTILKEKLCRIDLPPDLLDRVKRALSDVD